MTPVTESPSGPAGPAGPTPRRVLAVVNDLFFEAKIGEVMRALGVPVAFAKSADALAKRLEEAEPALALVDLGARGLDPIEAIRRIRAAGAPGREVPVFAFLSHLHPEAAGPAREAGATEVMAKSELVRRLPELARES